MARRKYFSEQERKEAQARQRREWAERNPEKYVDARRRATKRQNALVRLKGDDAPLSCARSGLQGLEFDDTPAPALSLLRDSFGVIDLPSCLFGPRDFMVMMRERSRQAWDARDADYSYMIGGRGYWYGDHSLSISSGCHNVMDMM